MSAVRGHLLIVAALAAGACSQQAPIPPGPFDSRRDATATIECYTAFIQRAIGSFQYDLRLTPEEIAVHQAAGGSSKGWRLQPYFDRAEGAVGEQRAVEIAQAYMFPIQTKIRAEPTPEGRRALFDALVVEKTRACHRLMDSWGAPPL